MVKYLIVLVLMLAQVACSSTSISRQEIQEFSYGEPPDSQEVISFIITNATFYDPFSAKVTCKRPYRGWAAHEAYGKVTLGWVTECSAYAKNRFGAYAGSAEVTVVSIYGGHQMVWGQYGK